MDEALTALLDRCLGAHGHFGHQAHVQLTWLLLERYPILEALRRLRTALRHVAAAHGQADRYHETLTLAFFLLVVERRSLGPAGDWSDFAARHPDVLDPAVAFAALAPFYPAELLSSVRARRTALLPT